MWNYIAYYYFIKLLIWNLKPIHPSIIIFNWSQVVKDFLVPKNRLNQNFIEQ